MVRALTIIVLAAQLLICPLRCLSCGISTNDGDVTSRVSAPCCQECENSSGEEDTSSGDCSCPSCICEGATVESVSLPAPEVTVVFADWLIPSNCDLFSIASAVATEGPPIECAESTTLAVRQVWLV